MAGKGSSQDAYANNKRSQISNVFSKVAGPGVSRANQEEKSGVVSFQVGRMQSHIALDTFQSSNRKLADEESLEDGRSMAVPGVFVVTETKTAVDDRRQQEV
jgi:hypothetical protein